MVKKNIILYTFISLSLLLSLFTGCSSKKISLKSFKSEIIEVNKRVNLLNKKLSPKNLSLKRCSLQKKNLLKIQKKNRDFLDKVFELENLLSYAEISPKSRKEMEKILDNTLKTIFVLRKKSRKRLLSIDKNKSYLCSLELKAIPKTKTCLNCIAVLN